jgi:ABC-type sulfate transport system permease subunit
MQQQPVGVVARTRNNSVVRVVLIFLSVLFLATFLIVPVVSVLGYAFSQGLAVYFEALRAPDTLSAIRLTLTTAAIVVPLNTIFGVAAAWAIAKFDFRGKQFLITLIDLPFSASPASSSCCCSARRVGSGRFSATKAFRSCTRYPVSCWRRCS